MGAELQEHNLSQQKEVKEATSESPSPSAINQASALKISVRSVRRMLNFTLTSIPTKFKLCKNSLKMIWLIAGVAVKKLFDSSVPNKMLSLWQVTKTISICLVRLKNKTSDTGQDIIQLNCIKSLWIRNGLKYGARLVGNCGIWGSYFFVEIGLLVITS